jgi:hypothetical protein
LTIREGVLVNTFEQGFSDVQKAAETAVQAATSVAKAARVLVKTAREGDIAKLRRAVERLVRVQETAAQEVANARGAWPFSEDKEEAYLREHFADELLAQAKKDGLKLFRRDEGLVAFPSLLRVLPTDRAARVDRKRVTTLRPSHLVAVLKSAQTKKSRFDAQRFIEALHRAYRLIISDDKTGATVLLERIYDVFTLLPGTSAEYSKADFARDLLMLDRSGITQTRKGAVVSLPASTGTKDSRSTISTRDPDGKLETYYGIRFTKGSL